MIKHYILSFLFFLVFLFECKSQVEVGIKGGYTHSWPGYGEIELPENAETTVSGLNLSVFIGSHISNGFGFSVSPGYVKRGAACFPGWQPTFQGDSKVFLNYFELPLMINKKFRLESLGIDIVPSVGYGFSYLNSAFLHQEQAFERVVVSEINVGGGLLSSFNRIEHGFYFNLRFDRNIVSNHFIFMETSYYHGMKDYDAFNVSKNRNLNFMLGFGYAL